MRIGLGVDVHRLVEGRELILGGVHIPYELGLLGHSDADVLAHAVSDAVLGAMRADDIGVLFPDTDPAYDGADSLVMMSQVASMAREQGFSIVDVDCVIEAQRPKLAPHRAQMRANIARALGIAVENVGVKATTTEGLGYPGRGEGIRANAVVLLEEGCTTTA